jgi:hypothetical protein
MTSLGFFGSLLLALSFMQAHAAKIEVEHSLNGGVSWSLAGTIEGSNRWATAEFNREPISSEVERELVSLAASDGFYALRIPAGRSDRSGRPIFVSTSIRASCLATKGASERIGLHLAPDGTSILSLEYALDQPCGVRATHAATTSSFSASALKLPASASAVVDRVKEGPSVIKLPPSGGSPDLFANSFSGEGPCTAAPKRLVHHLKNHMCTSSYLFIPPPAASVALPYCKAPP